MQHKEEVESLNARGGGGMDEMERHNGTDMWRNNEDHPPPMPGNNFDNNSFPQNRFPNQPINPAMQVTITRVVYSSCSQIGQRNLIAKT